MVFERLNFLLGNISAMGASGCELASDTVLIHELFQLV